MGTHTREQLIQAGRELARLMHTPAMDKALTLLREDFTSRFTNSDFSDKQGRENAYQMLHSLTELESVINTLIFAAEQDMLKDEDN